MRILSNCHGEIRVLPDAATLAAAVADEFRRVAAEAIRERGRFTVALAGGSTPKSLYTRLAEDENNGLSRMAWDRIHVFFGDERPVPADHAESNYRMAREALLSKAPIPEQQVFRIPAELPAAVAAERYEATLRVEFQLKDQEPPRFDLVLLGLGTDGHTASLFPGTVALHETSRLAIANPVPILRQPRITLTFPVLNTAAEVCFIVSGKEKAEMLDVVLRCREPDLRYPASAVRPTAGKLIWMVDEAAARRVSGASSETH